MDRRMASPKRPTKEAAGKIVVAGSVALLADNLGSGLLNYGYQIVAARRLGAADYGLFSTWLAEVSVVLAVATIAQMMANFLPAGWRMLTLAGGLAVALALA